MTWFYILFPLSRIMEPTWKLSPPVEGRKESNFHPSKLLELPWKRFWCLRGRVLSLKSDSISQYSGYNLSRGRSNAEKWILFYIQGKEQSLDGKFQFSKRVRGWFSKDGLVKMSSAISEEKRPLEYLLKPTKLDYPWVQNYGNFA